MSEIKKPIDEVNNKLILIDNFLTKENDINKKNELLSNKNNLINKRLMLVDILKQYNALNKELNPIKQNTIKRKTDKINNSNIFKEEDEVVDILKNRKGEKNNYEKKKF